MNKLRGILNLFLKEPKIFLVLTVFLFSFTGYSAFGREPLPSWNNTATKQAIFNFVLKVTEPGTRTYVPPEERIAVFDNDGTLWSEQPLYFPVLNNLLNVPV